MKSTDSYQRKIRHPSCCDDLQQPRSSPAVPLVHRRSKEPERLMWIHKMTGEIPAAVGPSWVTEHTAVVDELDYPVLPEPGICYKHRQ